MRTVSGRFSFTWSAPWISMSSSTSRPWSMALST